ATEGLLVLPALPLCGRTLPQREAAADRSGDTGAPIGLLPSVRGGNRWWRMMEQGLSSVSSDPLLKVENLVVEYAAGGKTIHAVSDVSLEIARGETRSE